MKALAFWALVVREGFSRASRRAKTPHERTSQSKNPILSKAPTGDWEVVIGLEVHAQVTSNAKLFSGASTDFGGDAEQPCLAGRCRDAGHAAGDQRGMRRAGGAHRARPEREDQSEVGVRPEELFLSRSAAGLPDQPVQVADRAARATSSSIMPDGESITVGIERLHLEQDAGKSLHDQHPIDVTCVDLNRSGVALMEIVSKPDMRSADEAKAYVTKLRAILRYLGTCDGDMEKGNLRADVNVSVRRPGEPFGTRCEIKNVNSIRFIGQAIEVRSAPPDRNPGRRRHDRSGDAPVRPRPGRDARPCARRKRRTTTAIFPIPICCRWSFRKAYVAELKTKLAGTAGRQEGAIHP